MSENRPGNHGDEVHGCAGRGAGKDPPAEIIRCTN